LYLKRAEYVFRYEDFVGAVKAYRRVSKRALISYYFCVWLWPAVLLIFGALCFYWQMQQDGGIFGAMFWLAALCFGLGFGLPARYRMGVRRTFNQRNVLAMGKPMFCEFDQTKIRFVVPGGTEISYPWDAFTDYFENDRVAVLFVKDAAFHTIPKRAMDEAGWSEFRNYVNSHARNL
jgi:hypothetical protein